MPSTAEITVKVADMPEVKELLEAGEMLAHAVDVFFNDLRYTAPEMFGERVNQFGQRITEAMAAYGYPKDKSRPKRDKDGPDG